MSNNELLKTFGKLLIKEVRDRVILEMSWIINNESNATGVKELHSMLNSFSDQNLEALKKFIEEAIDSSLHYTLFMFEQNNEEFDIIANPESNKPISLTKLSDGLCGELYSDDGWIKKYTKYKSSED